MWVVGSIQNHHTHTTTMSGREMVISPISDFTFPEMYFNNKSESIADFESVLVVLIDNRFISVRNI